jgi:hypothetical protein
MGIAIREVDISLGIDYPAVQLFARALEGVYAPPKAVVLFNY